MTKSRPADVFFLSCPRTLSNLLVKLLSEQAGWETASYHLHDAFQYGLYNLNDRDVECPAENFNQYVEMLRAGYQKMLAAREDAHKKGHALFLKNHIVQILQPSPLFDSIKSGEYASEITVEPESSPTSPHTNPTMLSDELLLSFVPLFMIRHPALVVDSYYRAKACMQTELSKSHIFYSTGVRFARALFEWYEDAASKDNMSADRGQDAECQPGSKGHPILLDADDIVEGDTVQRLAAAIGMHPEQIPRQWETKSTEGLDANSRLFVQGMWGSTRIDKSKSSKGLDLDAKFENWNELYGPEVGKMMADLTKEHMEDYLWLKERKF